MSTTSPTATPTAFGGYRAVAFVSLMAFSGIGTGYLSLAAYIPVWIADLHIDATQAGLVFSVIAVVCLVAYVGAASFSARFGLKRMLQVGTVAAIAANVIIIFATGAVTLYAAGLLIGVGSTWAGAIGSARVAENWFNRRLGLMLGVAVGSGALGAFVGNLLISELSVRFGWRSAAVAILVLTVMTMVPASLVIRTSPLDLGQVPLGHDKPAEGAAAVIVSGPSPAQATRSSAFVLAILVMFLIGWPMGPGADRSGT